MNAQAGDGPARAEGVELEREGSEETGNMIQNTHCLWGKRRSNDDPDDDLMMS